MRKDETGSECPETLGEYLALCAALAPDSRAVEFLQEKIAASPNGMDEKVFASDLEMRMVLMPNLIEPKTKKD